MKGQLRMAALGGLCAFWAGAIVAEPLPERRDLASITEQRGAPVARVGRDIVRVQKHQKQQVADVDSYSATRDLFAFEESERLTLRMQAAIEDSEVSVTATVSLLW